MTTAVRATAPATRAVPAISPRKTAIAAGVLYLITHVTSVGAVILYAPMLSNVNYIAGSGPDTRVLVGAFLEVILTFAIVGTAVALYPVVKRWDEGVAFGYVGLRTLEAGIIAVGVISLLAVVTLRQDLVGTSGTAGTDTTSLVTAGRALVALHNRTFLVGPSFTSGTDTVLMAYLMFRSRLVPPFIPLLGLIGGPLVFASATAVLFGLVGQYSTPAAITAIPEFAWELSLALWLIIKGFNRAALASGFGTGFPTSAIATGSTE
jgi:hypothetical protein